MTTKSKPYNTPEKLLEYLESNTNTLVVSNKSNVNSIRDGRTISKQGEYKVIELLKLGNTMSDTAIRVGITRKTVARILEKHKNEITQYDALVKKETQNEFRSLALRCVESITPVELKSTRPAQRIVMAGISTDKAQLLAGEATERVELLSEQELDAQIHRLTVETMKLRGKKHKPLTNA